MQNTQNNNYLDEHEDRRSCRRITLNDEVHIKFKNRDSIPCRILEVSLGGLSVMTYQETDMAWIGQSAQLLLDHNNNEPPFDCAIKRIGESILGLEVDKSAVARFGLAISQSHLRPALTS